MRASKKTKTKVKTREWGISETERRKRLRELRGKYASAFPSVDEFLRIKREEVKAGRL